MIEYAGSFWVIVQRGTTKRLVADFFRNRQYADETVDWLDQNTPGFKLKAVVVPVNVTFDYDST